jgi:hypothetical protein
LIQSLSGTSRRNSPRILGRMVSDIQFMAHPHASGRLCQTNPLLGCGTMTKSRSNHRFPHVGKPNFRL